MYQILPHQRIKYQMWLSMFINTTLNHWITRDLRAGSRKGVGLCNPDFTKWFERKDWFSQSSGFLSRLVTYSGFRLSSLTSSLPYTCMKIWSCLWILCTYWLGIYTWMVLNLWQFPTWHLNSRRFQQQHIANGSCILKFEFWPFPRICSLMKMLIVGFKA